MVPSDHPSFGYSSNVKNTLNEGVEVKKMEPKKRFKVGGVKASIFENVHQSRAGQEFTAQQVTVDRSYKDKDGEWKSTTSFKENDVPKAILVLQKAYEYMAFTDSDELLGKEIIEQNEGL